LSFALRCLANPWVKVASQLIREDKNLPSIYFANFIRLPWNCRWPMRTQPPCTLVPTR